LKQENPSNNNLFSAILVLALAARIPFLFFGYGVEEDSYGTVVAARNSYLTGVLEVSRLPGHPFQEIVLSFFYPISSPFFFNLLSCIASIFAIYFFGKVCKKYSPSFYWLAALVFAFVPVVFIASVSTIDYMWAMAFAMAAWYFMQKKQMLWAGVLFGLAIACRINIAALILPFVMIEYLEEQKINYKNWFFFLIVCTLTSFAFFAPVIHRYGWHFFSYSDQFPYPNFPKIIYKSSIGVWGILGIYCSTSHNLPFASSKICLLNSCSAFCYLVVFARLRGKKIYKVFIGFNSFCFFLRSKFGRCKSRFFVIV